jgi:hypothetical protein
LVHAGDHDTWPEDKGVTAITLVDLMRKLADDHPRR